MLRRAGIPFVLLMFAACTSASTDKTTRASEVSMPLWAMSTKSAEARAHMEKGARNADAGHPLQAYEEYKRAVAADSAFGFAYLRVAQSGQSRDEYRTNLQRASAYANTANPTEKLLIEIERKQFARDQQWALELAQQLVQKEPAVARSWGVLAGTQLANGDIEQARASAKKFLDLASEYGGAHLSYGIAYLLVEPIDLAKAEEHIQKGIQLWPNEPVSYDFLGDLRRRQGRLDEAATSYTHQIELDSMEWEGYSQRGHAYTFLGKYDQARADYDAAIRLAKGNTPVYAARYRAFVSAFAGDIPAAISELEQLVQAIDGMKLPEPEGEKIITLESIILLASHAHLFDRAEKALTEFRTEVMKGVERVGTPEFRRGEEATIAFQEARLAAFKGDYATADKKLSDFTKLVEQERNPTKFRRLHAVRGFMAYFRKDYANSLKEFNQADPDNRYLWYYRGLAQEALGRTAEAKALFRQVASYNFNQPLYSAVRSDAVARSK